MSTTRKRTLRGGLLGLVVGGALLAAAAPASANTWYDWTTANHKPPFGLTGCNNVGQHYEDEGIWLSYDCVSVGGGNYDLWAYVN